MIKKYEPALKSTCLCGSGAKFKHCCYGDHHSMKGRSSKKVIDLINSDEIDEAIKHLREYFTAYTICHKTNTEPYLNSNNEGVLSFLNMDINALNELLNLLFICYERKALLHEFESVCERLRCNIHDPRWQKRITYYQVRTKLNNNNWSQYVGEKEVTKFTPILEESDPEIIQIYFHFMSGKLPFKKRIDVLEHLISLLNDKGEKLQYKMAKAISYLCIEDKEAAIKIMSNALDKFNYDENDSIYTKVVYARCLSTLGDLKENGDLKKLAYRLLQKVREDSNLTIEGKSKVLSEMASCLFHLGQFDNAVKAYQQSYELVNDEVIKVFVSQCLTDKGDITSLEVLSNVKIEKLDPSGMFDYAVNYSYAAIKFECKFALIKAKDLLKKANGNELMFEKMRLKLICELDEMLSTGKFSRKKYVLDIIRNVGKFFILQPNIAGIGLDINRILDRCIKN